MVAHVAAFCVEDHLPVFQTGIRQYAQRGHRQVRTEFHSDSHGFLDAVPEGAPWDLLIVAVPGAMGMELVHSVRDLAPETPLLWCSDDADFAVASYRLRCSLFLPLPLEYEDVEAAMARCLET